MSETTTNNTEKITVKLKDRKMNKLENLVPPPELCKLIPAGDFEDSVHWHCWSYIDQKYLVVEGKPDVRLFREPCPCGMKYCYPAPTLHEIMAELSLCDEYADTGWFCMAGDPDHWSIGNCECDLYVKNGTKNHSPEVAALKVWLKMKGIER